MADKLMINPWFRMWTKPKDTIRAIVTMDPRYKFLTLSVIYGIPLMLQMAQNMSLGFSFSLVGILLGCLVLSLFAGMIGLTLAGGLLYITGKWLGGASTFLQVRCALAWSNVTNIISIILWAILIAFFGTMLFTDAFATTAFTQGESTLIFVVFLTQFVMSIWSFVLLVQSLAEVQGFTMWKAFLNILIAFGIVVGVFWVIGVMLVNG
ncbi:MAG: Yip1 family protein [Chlamydiae bacterium]|nr:Yip1 family protein [Chlamydiota bacterium]